MLLAGLTACSNSKPPGSGTVGGDVADAGGDAPDVTADTGADVMDTTPDVPLDVADAMDADVEDVPDIPQFPTVIVAVETRVSSRSVRAGDSVFVSCDAIDEEGELVALDEGVAEAWIIAPDNAMVAGDGDDELIAVQAGNAAISCMIPSLSLIDETPVDVRIDPGPPYTVITEVDRVIMSAGEDVDVECSAYDQFGNYIPDAELDIVIDPFGDGVRVYETGAVEIERSGLYTITCSAEGAVEFLDELVEVQPGLPATLAVGVEPDRGLYTIGDVVSLTWTVTDEFGNIVPNPLVQFSSVQVDGGGSVPSFGDGRYRFDREGIFRLTVFVPPPTASGEPLVGSVEVIVNEAGPTITCEYPAYGEMINGPPGAPVLVQGTAGDEFGVAEVLINGEPAFIRPDNSFILEVPGEFGVNFMEIEAFDELGESSRRTCAFLMADQWIPEGQFFDDDIALTMTQEAFDDGAPSDGLDSLNDVIWTILNAPELVQQVDAALSAANPIYPRTCVLDSWFGCIVRVGVDYRYFRLDGPNPSSLTLVEDGLRIAVTLQGIEVGLRINGTFGTSGDISLSRLGLTMTFNLSLSGGRPRVSVRRLDRVEVGSINSDFSGITGFVLDIVVDIFEDDIRDLLRDTVQDFIEEEINAVLDDTLSGLDIDSLGDTIEVPRLDSDEIIPVGFGIRFSSIDVTPAQAIFGIGSRFSAPISHAGFTFGAAYPPGDVLDDSVASRSVRAQLHLGLLNQLFHTLWRAGMFDATLGGGSTDGVPEDVAVTLYSNLPPVAAGGSDGSIEIHFGGMRAEVAYPSLLPEPIVANIGVKISTGVDVVGGDELDFRDIELIDFYFDPLGATLDGDVTETVEDFIAEIVQTLLDDALNSALPNFPIPSFELPDSITEFGLPGGAYFGILDPVLTIDPRHLTLQGNFGTR